MDKLNPTEDTSNASESSLSTKKQIRSALVFLNVEKDAKYTKPSEFKDDRYPIIQS